MPVTVTVVAGGGGRVFLTVYCVPRYGVLGQVSLDRFHELSTLFRAAHTDSYFWSTLCDPLPSFDVSESVTW